jgi:rhodanese-related sulfurtransferase
MPEELDRRGVLRLLEQEGVRLVDVLPHEEYEEEHLPGALSIPLRTIDRDARRELDPTRPVIVYCWDSA